LNCFKFIRFYFFFVEFFSFLFYEFFKKYLKNKKNIKKWIIKKVKYQIKKIEDYISKSQQIFTYLNEYRQNPKSLAKKLELIRTYLDPETNVLSEPNKIQIQMVEGDEVFKEAILYLKKLPPLPPLEWDENLAQSAMEHVSDIGPKGLLLYQSSNGMEPEERISKFGNYVESLGENIDFGPNDALGVIISLTLDDGEESRPHRDNLFKEEYHKVGIACGPHKTEFQMCVMDFAYDFLPLDNKKKNFNDGLEKAFHEGNQSPLVKLSLENEDYRKVVREQQKNNIGNINGNIGNNNNDIKGNNEVDFLRKETQNLMKNMKVVEKKVEIITKIIYTFSDGSTKEMSQTEKHSFKY
jgi:uncharacterized protein YkwD